MDIEVLQRAYEREKERRKQAEERLEEKSRELYLSYENLDASHQQLENSNNELEQQKKELVQLINAYASVTDDLQLAAQLQTDLLPKPIETETVSATGYFQPARFVAGDAYDYFSLPGNVFAFYIIDVEGHGTASAMTSFAIHSQLNPKYDGICSRYLKKCANHSEAVCATVKDLNDTFYNPNSINKYFTMVYGLIDLTESEVTWCQAGHPALVVCSEGKTTEIGDGGFPVGALEDPTYKAISQKLDKGNRLAIYSDGAIECFSKNNEAFGKSRLIELLDKSTNTTQDECVTMLKHSLLEWNGGDEFADDVTLLLIDFLKPAD